MLTQIKIFIALSCSIFLIFPALFVQAKSVIQEPNIKTASFKNMYDIQTPEIPILNRAYLDTSIDLSNGFVIANNDNRMIGSSLSTKNETIANRPTLTTTTPTRGNIERINDGKSETYMEFEPNENKSEFTIKFDKPITTSSFNYNYGPNVLESQFLQIELIENGKTKQLYDKVYNVSGYAQFPEITGNEFKVTFYHTNRLQLSEAGFIYKLENKSSTSRIEWLAEPGNSYKLYTNPDRYTPTVYNENLYRATDNPVLAILGEMKENSAYTAQDTDNDGVPDVSDNCPDYNNSDQTDLDNNKLADICEDRDLDGVVGFNDNCPNNENKDQKDIDNDKLGDLCDDKNKYEQRDQQLKWLIPVGLSGGLLVMIGAVWFAFKNKVDVE